jgi:hypothetical protein
MRLLHVAVVLLAAGLGGTVEAQLPLPLPGQPGPDLGKREQCTSDYARSVEQQVAVMEKLRSAGPQAIDQVCALVELGSLLLRELPDDTRRQLRELLGFDVDLKRTAAQCRQGQGDLERELISRLAFLRSELVRCNDTI